MDPGFNTHRVDHMKRTARTFVKAGVATIISLLLVTGCGTMGRERISWKDLDDLNRIEVIGALGVPICHYVEVEATVARKNSAKGNGDYRLDVTKVDGRALPEPLRMEFWDSTYEVPADDFARYEQLHGTRKDILTDKDCDGLDVGYVGKKFTLLVYESGQFHDPPSEEMDKYEDSRQLAGWGFSTNLRVVKVLSMAPQTLRSEGVVPAGCAFAISRSATTNDLEQFRKRVMSLKSAKLSVREITGYRDSHSGSSGIARQELPHLPAPPGVVQTARP